jgi:hypothetical protein
MASNSVLRARSKSAPESWEAARKSSIYTSVKLRGGFSGPWLRVVGGGMPWNLVAIRGSSSGGVRAVSLSRWTVVDMEFESKRALARSAVVSVTAQRKLGLSTHPIGRIIGKATSGSSSGNDGRMAPRQGIVASEIQTRMNASEMSVLANLIGPRRVSAHSRRWRKR